MNTFQILSCRTACARHLDLGVCRRSYIDGKHLSQRRYRHRPSIGALSSGNSFDAGFDVNYRATDSLEACGLGSSERRKGKTNCVRHPINLGPPAIGVAPKNDPR